MNASLKAHENNQVVDPGQDYLFDRQNSCQYALRLLRMIQWSLAADL